ncbi:hypothetical protein CHRY9390_02425 [Chryseobacterium aquaeductus]|uniref:Uncharacterized protein n=1 Tax=Chryseobacterium aquaeductus TaxID=2675056 RepID=A0A9N8MH69_9FLAO|nr:hypothetical protein [Chryseobacterium aquaeductus]CAA7331711.1 hypothetical protein CHRY9390_02425 [Chryseobacterium potabilaquae]CAD7811845.1 hypothetical protein CHRY9390_02425 [Chryseobacterium aquaeductus]
MKKTISFILISMSYLVFSQEKEQSPKKTFFGVQAGFLGTNVYNETNFSKEFALRTEFNLETSLFFKDDLFSEKSGFVMFPTISLSPKWYYNINKREKLGKNTANNSANYISAKLSYVPDWFVISNSDTDGLRVNPVISLVPTWGIRRNFGKNFNYEFQAGIGVAKFLEKDYVFSSVQVVPNLSFRIGYDF